MIDFQNNQASCPYAGAADFGQKGLRPKKKNRERKQTPKVGFVTRL